MGNENVVANARRENARERGNLLCPVMGEARVERTFGVVLRRAKSPRPSWIIRRSAFFSKTLGRHVAVQLVGIPREKGCKVTERVKENFWTELVERASRLTIASRAGFLLANHRPQRMSLPSLFQRGVFFSGD